MVDDQFSTAQQQDVSEFFIKLANVCTEVDIKTVLNMQWDYHRCSCEYSYLRRQQNYFLYLPVPDDTMNISLNTLFTIAEEWDRPPGFLCHTCGEQMKQREKLYSASEVIVVALKIFCVFR